MATGYEVAFYQNISDINKHLNRIANCMEAAEKRARREDEATQEFIKATTDSIREKHGG